MAIAARCDTSPAPATDRFASLDDGPCCRLLNLSQITRFSHGAMSTAVLKRTARTFEAQPRSTATVRAEVGECRGERPHAIGFGENLGKGIAIGDAIRAITR